MIVWSKLSEFLLFHEHISITGYPAVIGLSYPVRIIP